MNEQGSIRAFMAEHGIKSITDYSALGYVHVEMRDGRTGVGHEVSDALNKLRSWGIAA